VEAMTRSLVLISESKGGTSSNLFDELVEVLREHQDVRVSQPNISFKNMMLKMTSTLMQNLRVIRHLFWADVIILHVYAVAWAPTIIAARILRKKVIIFQWDVYPITINGKRFNKGIARRAADWLENSLLRLATALVVPSQDFLPYVNARKVAAIIPLWPQRQITSLTHLFRHIGKEPVQIGFAGQINQTRGIDEFINEFRRTPRCQIHLHVFSGQHITLIDEMPTNVQVTEHGYLHRVELQKVLRTMHFGLLCLSVHLDQPGFPSKTHDYLSAGLPILYFGKSLPAFTEPLVAARLAVPLSFENCKKLHDEYLNLSRDFNIRRDNFIETNKLTWKKIACLF
jgi:glycosyltransferase involved in cell wall biosynthesis